ncbi:hypothetical protein BaRGS_00008866 [Batillaria attramentaria]|uniref:Uncharacterized protein n=1 Tax=Batillaria attramentaria TaxID=370345 RepID=A0ABD0LJS7_9CAEN
MNSWTLLLMTTFSLFTDAEAAGCFCYNNDDTRCYKFENEEQVNYKRAQKRCEYGGGSLAVLETQDIFSFVYNRRVQQNYWIGLLKTPSGPTEASWVTGENLNRSLYTFNFQLDDDRHPCVRMREAPYTQVADYPCASSYYYVCDKSCRSFSFSDVARRCRLHSYDLTSLTSYKSSQSSWSSFEKVKSEPAHCEDVVALKPCAESGVFTIYPSLTAPPLPVYCRLGDDDVNWLVLMRKTDNANFERTYEEYVSGFGDPDGDFWLGLASMELLTPPWFEYELLVQFTDGAGQPANASYSDVTVTHAADGSYVINYAAFTGDSEDYLSGIQGNKFGSRPPACSACQSGWWEGVTGCNCDPTLLMIRLVRRVHG